MNLDELFEQKGELLKLLLRNLRREIWLCFHKDQLCNEIVLQFKDFEPASVHKGEAEEVV
ncbi:hypothetical protein E1A91_D07G047000v1 [Gossypium mustelinum]|uniref:Uncharacterized protein n=1 Tax=Gossypium mustelinum TaxID=34275 RepID=A0A5D2U5R6_GOSMU|nr:hypothetical protein E1A91_D07G047000v1 [Gossypium mustelinum]